MVRVGLRIGALAAIAIGGSAQVPPARPVFDVASIKLATPLQQAIADGSLMGMKMDPSYVHVGHYDLAKLIMTAYGVRRDQIIGPDWLLALPAFDKPSTFDIDAKLPAGATESQVPLMLQALLEERFKLAVHKGSRESEGYALVVGKGGLKFSGKNTTGPAEALRDESVHASEGRGEITVRLGQSTVTTIPGRLIRVETSTIAGLVEFLRLRLAIPVIDKTGLEGDFNIRMDVELAPPVDTAAGASAADAGAPGAAALRRVTAASSAVKESIVLATKKLGLDLERQQIPLETIIVDHVEKTPTEN
jgi:uncharacterized protein (TIGR03435 family)